MYRSKRVYSDASAVIQRPIHDETLSIRAWQSGMACRPQRPVRWRPRNTKVAFLGSAPRKVSKSRRGLALDPFADSPIACEPYKQPDGRTPLAATGSAPGAGRGGAGGARARLRREREPRRERRPHRRRCRCSRARTVSLRSARPAVPAAPVPWAGDAAGALEGDARRRACGEDGHGPDPHGAEL